MKFKTGYIDFIGSQFRLRLANRNQENIVDLVSFTYAGNLQTLANLQGETPPVCAGRHR